MLDAVSAVTATSSPLPEHTVADRRGLEVSAATSAAASLLDAATDALAGHRAETSGLLEAALREDPTLLLAHVLRGFGCKLLARREANAPARAALAAAEASAARRGATERERAHLAALAHLVAGRAGGAADLLAGVSRRWPLDLAALKLEHAVRFMMGDAPGMRRSLEAALPAWEQDTPGRGYMLGCHAFALGETSEPERAAAAGRLACEVEPRDAWGAHAVAHAHEMQGEAATGLAWLASREPHLAGTNNFAHHLAWHEALFHLELGRPGDALGLYDRRLAALKADDFRDLANAASLLARIEEDGVSVGGRWAALADLAEGRVGDATLGFAAAHQLLALLGAGRTGPAERLVATLRSVARYGARHQDAALRDVAVPLADALLARARGDHAGATDGFLGVRRGLGRLGGSDAQRDVFWRLGIDSALRARRPGDARSLLAERARMFTRSRWAEERAALAEDVRAAA